MDEEEKRIRRKLRDDFIHYASKCLKIRSKSGDIKPFLLNKAQLYIHEKIENQRKLKGKVRAIICKGRQQGCSSYIEGRYYWRVTHRFGVRAFILTHDTDATNNLFEMANRYHEHCPSVVRPTIEASNAKELIFAGLDSGYKLGTAGNKAVGRSSTIQYLHGSEVAYWPNAAEHAKGILQAVPNDNETEIILESTVNGIGNYYHEQWQLAEAGLSDFIAIFVPWFWQDEYKRIATIDFTPDEKESELIKFFNLNNDQLMWRRNKIAELSAGGMNGEKAFQQEYPNTSYEAFIHSGDDTFISASTVNNSRINNLEKYGHLIIGVDPARFGDDRSSIIRRQGRCAYGLQSFIKKDTMEMAGIVHRIIEEEKPFKVCIDIGGLGAGVYDRLVELGHKDICVAVNGGSTPLNQKRYYNKRAEMWGEMRDWLNDCPSQIPDIDSLHSDLCGIKYKYDSNSRLVLEKKEDMRKRGLRSPDEADALALTFALPNSVFSDKRINQDKLISKNIMSNFNKIDRLKKSAYRR